MPIHKSEKRKARDQLDKLPYLSSSDLVRAAAILGCTTAQTIQGGITARLDAEQLRQKICSAISRGSNAGQLKQFVSFVKTCTIAADPLEETERPEQQVVRLIQQVQTAAIALSDEALLQVVNQWIARFQGDCWDTLDERVEPLGFHYEEDEEGAMELVPPSPDQLKQAFRQQSLSDFYHSFIWLAASAELAGFSPPPSNIEAGYKFMGQLAKYLESLERKPS